MKTISQRAATIGSNRVFRRWLRSATLTALAAVLAASFCTLARGATLCVSQHAKPGCFLTIQSAVNAAAVNDTIMVAPGTYKEQVTISRPVSLIAADHGRTIIDATGLPTGIFIDGTASAPNAGVTDVTVTGFRIENANFEGILVANASNVTLAKNQVVHNDRALDTTNGTCPNIPAFETNEGFDCGEGIHLIGVDHAIVADNDVENNAGGILLSDETGPTDRNVITGNRVRNNAFDCGITLASHSPAKFTQAAAPFGAFDNTIADNDSSRNGLGLAGEGAGVGLFAPGPQNKTYGNVVVDNRLTGNGLPGVAIHNHAPTQNINLGDNVIVDNFIAGNGPGTDVETTPGTAVATGVSLLGVSLISGTVITHNVIEDEAIDIAVNNANNAAAAIDAHLNDLPGGGIGIANLGAGTINAQQNWWGCAGGPGTPGCSSVTGANVVTAPFLTAPVALLVTAR